MVCHNRAMASARTVIPRAAADADHAFIVEMARQASVIEDRPLPDTDDDDVLGMLPSPGSAVIIAEDHRRAPVGAVWTYHGHPPLRSDAAGTPLPELCIAVVPQWRGCGVGGRLLDALFVALRSDWDAMCTNVHVRNPAKNLYARKGFRDDGPGRGPLGLAMIKHFR